VDSRSRQPRARIEVETVARCARTLRHSRWRCARNPMLRFSGAQN